MITITAKFNSHCAATGAPIRKGEKIRYDQVNKKAYKMEGKAVNQDAQMIQANEEMYYDNFCSRNNI